MLWVLIALAEEVQSDGLLTEEPEKRDESAMSDVGDK